jgi:uncharacterized membrane protein YgdD (TMEM256/DUF423 family)
MSSNKVALRVTAVLGALGVGLGAFGAHGLKETLAANGTAEIWSTAVLYHLVHVAAMLAVAYRAKDCPVKWPWILFLVGILIFSGSLYTMAITNIRKLGMITPLGGVSFIIGWIWLAICPGGGSGQPAESSGN